MLIHGSGGGPEAGIQISVREVICQNGAAIVIYPLLRISLAFRNFEAVRRKLADCSRLSSLDAQGLDCILRSLLDVEGDPDVAAMADDLWRGFYRAIAFRPI